jgi:hypothetical protein
MLKRSLLLVCVCIPLFARGGNRAISELAGKFKWGMTPDDVYKILGADLHKKYEELIKKEADVYQQDELRKKEKEDLDKVKASYIKFDGNKTGWDVSIIDKEFHHYNDESMVVLWELDQRRFLFFWHGKLYKQFNAFNAEHPIFAGKKFDDFAKLIQNRYGTAQIKFANMRTKDEAAFDHLEWPVSGDYLLWALDLSTFYGNFCLSLTQASQISAITKARADHPAPKLGASSTLIDAVTQPQQAQGDPNADVVDDVLGRKGTSRTNPSDTPAPTKKKK